MDVQIQLHMKLCIVEVQRTDAFENWRVLSKAGDLTIA
jgi:hypothetical protein